MPTRKAISAVLLGVAAAIGGTLVLASGCTVLTNDAPPDDAGLFEGGDAKTNACDVCLSFQCAAPQALCLTNASCANVLTCATASECACRATADGGPSPERLYHAYTACNDAKLTACASDCAPLNRPPSTVPACSAPDDGGIRDAGADADADAGDTDAGDASTDAEAPDAGDAAAPGPDACVACAAANCSAAVQACASGSECGHFLACSSVCTTASCLTDCANQYATGKVAATQLATCTASNCQKSCEL